MANCSSCGAPLPASSITCTFCKTRNDTDLRGIHHFTTNSIDSARMCPHCNILLKSIDLQVNGTFLIERCSQCFGLFFDPGELESLLEAAVSNVYDINRARLDNINSGQTTMETSFSYVKCPVCSSLMNRVNFGVKSGVIVDRCREHGVWLDAGELRHLFEWMKAGGKLLNQERLEQQKREAEKKLEREKRQKLARPDKPTPEYYGFEEYGRDLSLSDPDLFALVKKAIRWFM